MKKTIFFTLVLLVIGYWAAATNFMLPKYFVPGEIIKADDLNRNFLAISNFLGNVNAYNIPRGAIVLWSGAVNEIPQGWALCDGTNGTPDLRNRFVIGAGGAFQPHNIGGSTQYNIFMSTQVELLDQPIEGKTIPLVSITGNNPQLSYRPTKQSVTVSVGQTLQNVRPPYYALCYIMKL